MILAYHRPETLEEALLLVDRAQPLTLPLGGGRILSRPDGLRATPLLPAGQDFEVVDIQNLGLDRLEYGTKSLAAGAAVRLADLAASLDGAASPAAAELSRIIRYEFNPNQAASATAAGALVSAAGGSPYAAAMLALEATCELAGTAGSQSVPVSDLLALRREVLLRRLVTRVVIPLGSALAFEVVARTPADRPLVYAVVARWASGRTRVTIGGWGPAPIMVLDGPESGGAAVVARQAAMNAADEWASAGYRSEMAAVLVDRCLGRLEK